MSGGKATVKKKDCCESETVIPTDFMAREEFCAVTSKGRKCTDVFCCFIFVGFLAAWAACFGVGWYFGEPLSLIYARDYQDRLCGGVEFPDKNLAYYPRLKDDLLEYAMQTIGSLESLDIYSLMDNLDFDILNLTGICMDHCPEPNEVVCTPEYLEVNPLPSLDYVAQCQGGDPVVAIDGDFSALVAQMTASLSLFGVDIPKNAFFHSEAVMCTNCWPVWLNTTELFFRCFDIITTVNTVKEVCTHPDMTNTSTSDPNYIAADDVRCLTKAVADDYDTETTTYDNPLAELLGVTLSTLNSAADDIENARWPIIVVGIGGSMAMGFLYIIFLRYCAGCLIWTTVTAFILFLMGFAGYSWLMSGYFDTTSAAEWLSNFTSSVGLDAWSVAIDTWLNATSFTSENVSVSSAYGIDITTDTQTLWRVGAFSFSFLFLIVVILTILVAKKIKIAICIIEEASVAILSMPCLVFFPFTTAVFLLVNFAFAMISMMLVASADGVTWDDIFGATSSALDVNCTDIGLNYNSSNYTLDVENATASIENLAAEFDALTSWLQAEASSLTCGVFVDAASALADVDVILFLNFFQLFCFLWMNAVLQGIGIMIVAGAVADWYWTRPSFDPSVKEEEWTQHLEGARSFHGLPEGVFVRRGNKWDLMLNVDRLALDDQHIVKYDKTDSMHRQLLGMRGYETDPIIMEIPDDTVEHQALISHLDTHAAGIPEGQEHVHAGFHRVPTTHLKGMYVRFKMENLRKWKTGLRPGDEAGGEDPRAFYVDETKSGCGKPQLQAGLRAALIRGKVSAPAWGEKDMNGVPCWHPEAKNYYPLVQDPRGFYGPVDPNFGKIITTPDHQRLNNQYVHQMVAAGKLRKGGNGKDFKSPFFNSMCRTLRFHLGSVCVGAFLIALVQTIRAILMYIDKQTQAWQNKNKCYRCMFKVLHAIMCLVEKCMKYISQNAYIMVAMRGKAFCAACCDAFKLLLTNLIQFAIVGVFSKVVVFFGKLFITCATLVGVYCWLRLDSIYSDSSNETYVDNIFIPLSLTFLLAFSVASAFLHVYDLTIATMLLCFCEDYKYHSVDELSKTADHDEVFMPTSLRNIVLPPKSRAHLPHAMTYEEVRVYATHVHGITAPPHKAPEHAQCCGKPRHTAEVTPTTYNVVKKQHTIVDYDSEAAKAKVDDMHKNLEADEVRRAAVCRTVSERTMGLFLAVGSRRVLVCDSGYAGRQARNVGETKGS
eukprot:INCI16328.9.p1 GENE.INCI16328.9~~INCI16328.9.p1  ORF type:complete len:1224 (+),score=199.72 INCI16328.9:164-3835(+)